MTNDTRYRTMRNAFKRYSIETRETPPKIKLPPKFLVKRYNNCMNIQECTVVCIYGVHRLNDDGTIAEPISELCRGCHLCVLACPKGAISVEINPEFLKLGNSYFTPDRMERIYFEAETGRVPVSGAGYGGLFAGRGFDSIWFDFSEIVRPTRDGIHGREYISTSIDIGRKLPYLKFDDNGALLSNIPKNIEVPIPMLLDAPCTVSKNLQLSVVKAAAKLDTFAIVRAEDFYEKLLSYTRWIIPRVKAEEIEKYTDLIDLSQIVEIDCHGGEDFKRLFEKVREINSSTLVSFRLPYNDKSATIAETLVDMRADIAHFYIDDKTVEQNPDYIVKAIRAIHLHLVDKGVRDQITFISSGGVAEASHIPKSILLGADAVAVGLAYHIALGCRVCYGENRLECLVEVGNGDVEWATQRIVNMMASWRDQLLEVLGGMGMREVRRLRGEVGRAMFYEELEAKVFGGDL